jgi:hypothetical protein
VNLEKMDKILSTKLNEKCEKIDYRVDIIKEDFMAQCKKTESQT